MASEVVRSSIRPLAVTWPPRLSRYARLGVVDQDAPHLAGGNFEKVSAVLPWHFHRDQLDEGLMHDRGGLQRVAGPLAASCN